MQQVLYQNLFVTGIGYMIPSITGTIFFLMKRSELSEMQSGKRIGTFWKNGLVFCGKSVNRGAKVDIMQRINLCM